MSSYVSPFLVLNLGCEMIFVIAQRLQAQNVPEDRSTLVLEDLISGLTSKQLSLDIMKPQPMYSQQTVREIIERITQSSAMRLDIVSMNKLWDLITMVFKWQICMSSDVIGITLRHLYEIETYVASEETQLQLHEMQTMIENFNKVLISDEKKTIHSDLHHWCKNFNVKVSLLLRMGLQDIEGQFVVNNLDPVAEKMLKNIGENIYYVTQNGRILQNQTTDMKSRDRMVDHNVNELNSASCEDNSNSSRSDQHQESLTNAIESKLSRFDSIDVDVDKRTELQDYMQQLNIEDDNSANTSFKEELLNMIGKYDNQSAV